MQKDAIVAVLLGHFSVRGLHASAVPAHGFEQENGGARPPQDNR